jgi:hypothetical protein
MKKLILILNLIICILLIGCGGSSGSVPAPVSNVVYTYSGSIYNTSQSAIYNTNFIWNDYSNYSFDSDSSGNFTFNITNNFSENFNSFTNADNGYVYSVFFNPASSAFTGPYVYFNNANPFIIKNTIDITSRGNLLSIILLMVNNDYTNAKTQAETYLASSGAGTDYYNYLRILRDFSDLRNDFTNVETVNPAQYVSGSDFTNNYYSPITYYGGMIYCMKTLLSNNVGSSLNILNCIAFLEKVRADELDFIDNNMNIFGLSSDDIKAMLLLAYIYSGDTSGISTFNSFSPSSSNSQFATHINNMIGVMGY